MTGLMSTNKRLVSVLITGVFALQMGCGREADSFSIIPEETTFTQSQKEIQTKIDILWVIDNSGSMRTSQENVANNFQSFITGFASRNLDYKMAVTTTAAWQAIFTADPTRSKFKSYTDPLNNITTDVMTPETPNLEDVFLNIIIQGTTGTGDERAFQSFRETLNNSLNAGFIRSDSHLAVIIVSDEDDFSHDGSDFKDGIYTTPPMHSVQSYVDSLETITNSFGPDRRFSVSTIQINDETCRVALGGGSARKVGIRYQELVSLTEGKAGDLCNPNFGDELTKIAENILTNSSAFKLDRVPKPESIKVWVNGALVPESATNGWTYNATKVAIVFHGEAVPATGAKIKVYFDPVDIKQ